MKLVSDKKKKQIWNKVKYRCKCNELIDKGICDKGFIRNPSNCVFEWDKSSDVGEYLDYENYKCRNRLADKLAEEFTENVEEVKLAKITSSKDQKKHKNKYTYCTLYVALFSIIFTINIGIDTYFVYFHRYLKRDIALVKFGTYTQTRV